MLIEKTTSCNEQKHWAQTYDITAFISLTLFMLHSTFGLFTSLYSPSGLSISWRNIPLRCIYCCQICIQYSRWIFSRELSGNTDNFDAYLLRQITFAKFSSDCKEGARIFKSETMITFESSRKILEVSVHRKYFLKGSLGLRFFCFSTRNTPYTQNNFWLICLEGWVMLAGRGN